MEIDIVLDEESSYKIHLSELKTLTFDRKVLIITNAKVAGLHLSHLLKHINAKELYVHTLQDGEEYKNINSIEDILESAFNNRLDRKSLFIAFGGGVVGDMVGFAAGIYQRGVDFIQIPTTLLSQVDSSVGGKTGINNKFGKNLVGLFNQPKAVYIDTHYLQTLPPREFGAGVAEIVKMAVMFDSEFFDWLESNRLEVEDTQHVQIAIKRAVELKADVVSKDEKEAGIRAVLNYGHTFAHVLENITNYTGLLHGEAVAIGICMANKLAIKLNLLSHEESARIEDLLSSYDLPTTFRIEDPASFYEQFLLDKKSENSKIKFILPHNIGNFRIKDDIAKEILLEVLDAYR